MGKRADQELAEESVGKDSYPIYEAKHFHQFDHRFASSFGLEGERIAPEVEKSNPRFSVATSYVMQIAEVERRLAVRGAKQQWLIAYRDITNATNERTVIAAVLPRYATNYTIRLCNTDASPSQQAALLANINSMVLDFVARQKLGGTHLSDYVFRQFPILAPDRYISGNFDFIIPRVLELTYTAHDLQPWAQDLGYNGAPFKFDPDRRALLRAELDAWFARAYGLNREELRYILNPADVMGDDYPSETFRGLKNKDLREFGEYRTARLVLREFDRMTLADEAKEPYVSLLVPPPGQMAPLTYSPLGVIRNKEDARFAGLLLALIREANKLPRQQLALALVIAQTPNSANNLLAPEEASLLDTYRLGNNGMFESDSFDRLQTLLRFFEETGVIRIDQQGVISAVTATTLPPGIIVEENMVGIVSILLRTADASLKGLSSSDADNQSLTSAKQA